MGKNNIIQTSVFISLGFIGVGNATTPQRLFSPNPISIECKNYKIGDKSNSTRINKANRFSLDRLKMNKIKLQSFAFLDKGWNGYDSEKIDSELINRVEKIISSLDFQPNIFPTGRGSIQIEKFINDNNFAEIEISKDEIFSYSIINGVENEGEISSNDINSIISVLNE